jgi:hypothetical protein
MTSLKVINDGEGERTSAVKTSIAGRAGFNDTRQLGNEMH